MSWKVYIDEEYLKGLLPEADSLIYESQGEEDLSKEKAAAGLEVMQNFIDSGFRGAIMRTDLSVTTEASDEDYLTRMRCVTNPTVNSATAKTITLLGCNTADGTFETVTTLSYDASETGQKTTLITTPYKFYKVSSTPSGITYTSLVTETILDQLHAYRWGMLIARNRRMQEGDRYDLLYRDFREEYQQKMSNMKINYDVNEDGLIESKEVYGLQVINYTK